MEENELLELLDSLLALESENEVIEFKEANNDYDLSKIGKYFSALGNEANLKNKKNGWLVFGVKDKGHTLISTNYRPRTSSLHKLKEEIGNRTTDRITFQEIYEVNKEIEVNGTKKLVRVILFQIPPAPRGIPIAWDGHYYARDNESLQPLNLEKIERIRNQQVMDDFSVKICDGATIEDLDAMAIAKARMLYSQKNPDKREEMKDWDDITFLNKAKITINGKITNTAIILLGKAESEHFLSPSIAKISWILKDRDGIEIDYEHFGCPFILSLEKVYGKIRNLKYRYLRDGTLFPEEVDKYDPYIIREALNNCIAHQDYTLAGKINVIEKEDSLIFSNSGNFIPGNIENVIGADSPSEYYRNRFLADAMVSLKMIDTIGSGIKKMFILQKNKYFPLPEYEISENKVTVTIIGKVLDTNYALKLIESTNDLSLHDIILLDKVQKNKVLLDDEANYLRKKGYIEGRKPNYYISFKVAQGTSLVGDYIMQQRTIDEQRDKIFKLIEGYKKGISKKEIMTFVLKNQLFEKGLSGSQQESRLRNILTNLRELGKIEPKGSGKKWLWMSVKD